MSSESRKLNMASVVIIPSEGKLNKILWSILFSIHIKGEEFTVAVEESWTVLKLKEAIDDQIGVVAARQALFLLGYPLTENGALLKDLLHICRTFSLVLSEGGKRNRTGKGPREVTSDEELFLIREQGSNFEAILLQANTEQWIKLESGYFGVVKHIEGEESGKRIFHFWQYEVKTEGSIAMRTEDGTDKVYLVIEEGPNGEEDELKPIDMKTYDERARVAESSLANAIPLWLTAIGNFLLGCKCIENYFLCR